MREVVKLRATNPGDSLRTIGAKAMRSAVYGAACAHIRETDALTLDHMCAATRIPAPSGHEGARASWVAERLRELDLSPSTDAAGNVHAVTPSSDAGEQRVVVAAHLDTVFDGDTDIAVVRDGGRLSGPGISDNGRGLAGMLAIARALRAVDWPTYRPVAFVATVGEEGRGDLRGVKHYMQQNAGQTHAFIALDGAGSARIINAGVGSRRLLVTYRGTGGHSWSDFGMPNAIHAAGRAIAALASIALPSQPRTTLNVGRVGGGTSVNAIPEDAWFELDLRSDGVAALHELEARAREVVEHARAADPRAAELRMEVDVIGDRPAGRTPEADALVQAALHATRRIGLTPELASSSTDANVPMSLGIPAIAIGAGGDSGGTHTVREWYDNRGGAAGLERALAIVLAAAGSGD